MLAPTTILLAHSIDETQVLDERGSSDW